MKLDFQNLMFVHGKVNKIVQFKVKDIPKEDLAILSRKAVGQEALDWVQKELQPRNSSMWNCTKYTTIWGICRNWRRHCRVTSY